MRLRACFVALLVVCLPVRALSGQKWSEPPALAAADRAFADALVNHDRAAFVALFTPDAESSLPKVTRGAEAIANAWLPFLIDPGTTMLLTRSAIAATTDENTWSSWGTFAVRGRTNGGTQTIPLGTYAITWRLVDGRWKIASLSGTGTGTPKTADPRDGGVGPFRFGMTRDEVSRVPDCQPYTAVAVTGGLECSHYRFEEREMNISFLFAGERLRRIQLWYYEGDSSSDARDAISRVVSFLQRTTGGAAIKARPDVAATPEAIVAALNGGRAPVGRQIVSLEIYGRPDGSTDWFARVGRHEHGYLVMLFADGTGR